MAAGGGARAWLFFRRNGEYGALCGARWRARRPCWEVQNSVGSNGETVFGLHRERAFDRRYQLL